MIYAEYQEEARIPPPEIVESSMPRELPRQAASEKVSSRKNGYHSQRIRINKLKSFISTITGKNGILVVVCLLFNKKMLLQHTIQNSTTIYNRN